MWVPPVLLGLRSLTDAYACGPQEPEEPDEEVPAVEWWDKGLLAFGSYEQDVPEDVQEPIQLNDRKVWCLGHGASGRT